jgi:hypothetical protein
MLQWSPPLRRRRATLAGGAAMKRGYSPCATGPRFRRCQPRTCWLSSEQQPPRRSEGHINGDAIGLSVRCGSDVLPSPIRSTHWPHACVLSPTQALAARSLVHPSELSLPARGTCVTAHIGVRDGPPK